MPSPWPQTVLARRQAIAAMEAQRPGCMSHAGFLATLGALYVDDGQPETALLWLERALLLDPGMLGARGDHALALAALGERLALQDLLQEWRQRRDVPPALLQRMESAAGTGLLPWNGRVRLGREQVALRRWGLTLEGSLLAGLESNLDQSPELSELTITVPEGDLVFPVSSVPRRGVAMLGQGLAVLAYNPGPDSLLQTGLGVSARSSPRHPQTDWQQLQWATAWVQRGARWRLRTEASVAWVRGSLPDPHQTHRAGVDLEAEGFRCRWRAAAGWQDRTRSETPLFDASSSNFAGGLRCPVVGRRDWEWGVALRHQTDRPDSDDRPGGIQRSDTLSLRLTGLTSPRSRLQLDWALSRARDSTGYSPLLENNAVRQSRLQSLDVEWTLRLSGSGAAHTDWLWRVQLARQESNIVLFAYRSASVYSGLRWGW